MTDAATWARLQELFEAALEVPASERTRWLQGAVEDSALRREVEELLGAHEDDGRFDALSEGLAELAEAEHAADPVPREIAGYRIESVLGEGGVARVYAARATGDASAPRVAIKVLLTSADTDRVRRRFLAEREILAGLGHPGIARFVEAGLTPGGVPYLVTEFVDGRPIHAHCDALDLGPEARLRLVLGVCDAAGFAHGKEVVHRDLKPANILVDRDGCVRLIDFGIAKVLGSTVFPRLQRRTSTGIRVLTFRYASPEQLSGGDVTPASDVYQIGLLVHRLLAGHLPPMASKFSKDGAHASHGSISRIRGIDDIVVRALHPDAARRFADGTELGDAIRGVLERAGRGGWRAWWRRLRNHRG